MLAVNAFHNLVFDRAAAVVAVAAGHSRPWFARAHTYLRGSHRARPRTWSFPDEWVVSASSP